jgi:hypothetical protein
LLLYGRNTIALAEVCKAVKHHCAHVVRLIHDLAVPSGVSDLIPSRWKESSEFAREQRGHRNRKTFL